MKITIFLVVTSLYLISCKTTTINCPPKFTIYRDINDAFPVVAKDFNLELKASTKALDSLSTTGSVTLKTSTTKLRQDLDNISSRVEMLIKSNLQGYYSGICDPAIRQGYQSFQNRLVDFTLEMSKIKEHISVQRSNSADSISSNIAKAQSVANSLSASIK